MNRLAFCIQGDAMSPTLHHKDVVICSEINHFDLLEEGQLYAVVTASGAVLVKRLHNIRRNTHNQIIQLKWMSDNDPNRLDVLHRNDVRQILQVQQCLQASA